MDYANFVDRLDEMSFLREVLNSPGFQFVPVWGRRRVGKTALLLKALGGRGVYFLAVEAGGNENLRRFREDASRCLDDPSLLDVVLDWEALFRYLAGKDVPVVIDEFPYLVKSDPSIPSLLQRIVDTTLGDSGVKLILCGSSVRMMEEHVLRYRAPLYGRRTGQLHLLPMRFAHLREFFPSRSAEDIVRTYGVCGGVPMYLREFREDVPFWECVEKRALNPNSLLFAEADMMLKQEFTGTATYRSILAQIASGRTRAHEIRRALDAEKSDISPYLKNLSSVGLVSRHVPATERPERSRMGIYRIDDNYLNFHFRYVVPARSLIEAGGAKGVVEYIRNDFDAYLGGVYEQVAAEAFLKWSAGEGLSWDRVGSWWYGEDEVDLLALSKDRNEMFMCEIKWNARPMGKDPVLKLIEKGGKVRWGRAGRTVRRLVVSRAGFTDACLHLMDGEGVLHWTLEDVARILWGGIRSNGRKGG
jgi:AAA+ ATPase superfamily predicted ATPase